VGSNAPLTNMINQVLPNPGVLPYVQQQNFGQMIGFVSDQNPDCDPSTIQVIINNVVRKIYDRRTWFGLMVYGQIACVGQTIGGSVNITQGSPYIQGVGTAWTPAVVGKCFRLGYNVPPMVVTALDVFNQILTLQMPWAGVSYVGAGYFIAQYYYTIGPNIKYIHTAKNLLMAWRLQLGYNQQTLDSVDVWRINTFMPACLAQMPLDQNGGYQVELWPVPAVVQALPFIACVQPPNLQNDWDSLPAYIRTDIVTKFAIADAKVYRGPKLNKYYDMPESQRLRGEAEQELVSLAMMDENLYRQNLIHEVEGMRMAPTPYELTATYGINHGVAASDGGGWW
jgi:hypothetical protein